MSQLEHGQFDEISLETNQQQELLKTLPAKIQDYIKWLSDPRFKDARFLTSALLDFISSISNKGLAIKIIQKEAEKYPDEKEVLAHLIMAIPTKI